MDILYSRIQNFKLCYAHTSRFGQSKSSQLTAVGWWVHTFMLTVSLVAPSNVVLKVELAVGANPQLALGKEIQYLVTRWCYKRISDDESAGLWVFL